MKEKLVAACGAFVTALAILILVCVSGIAVHDEIAEQASEYSRIKTAIVKEAVENNTSYQHRLEYEAALQKGE